MNRQATQEFPGIADVPDGALAVQGFERPIALVSLCFLGVPCRYHGREVASPSRLRRLAADWTLVPICPELLGGFPTPRAAAPLANLRGGHIRDAKGRDITPRMRAGAELAVQLARIYGARQAFLCSGSPSCDVQGFAGLALARAGVRVENL